MPKKPRQRLDNLPERTRESLRTKTDPDAQNSGYYNDPMPEPVPVYNQSPSEQVYKGSNNSFIIMGRDRPRGAGSGYGGAGASHSGCIDIVAGMTGIMCRSTDANGEEVVTDKSPELDAARIYISQQTDIDENFHLAAGVVGNLKARSGIAIKADGVRIIGREGIKLVTSSDNHDAAGLWIGDTTSGIDLIAGNDDSGLQPLVKGTSLREGLLELNDLIGEVTGILTNLMIGLLTQKGVQSLGSIDPATKASSIPMATFVLPNLIAQCQAHTFELFKWNENYLAPWGDGYISSRYNHTN